MHGVIPIPPPAVTALLTGVPTFGVDIAAELVTPTGAALAVTLSSSFGRLPAMRVSACGYGAGTKRFEQRPNLLRVMLGEVADEAALRRRAATLRKRFERVKDQLRAGAKDAGLL
jgi:uncharacterized protein (DUF111 family)